MEYISNNNNNNNKITTFHLLEKKNANSIQMKKGK